MSEQQTHFSWSHPHFSETHATHKVGITDPIQQHLELRLPNGRCIENNVGSAPALLPMFERPFLK